MQKLIRNLNYLWNKFKNNDNQFWDTIEEQLILGDVSVDTVLKILDKTRDYACRENVNDIEGIKNMLKGQIIEILYSGDQKGLSFSPVSPTVFLIVGVNGVGKTTTIAKMAKLFKNKEKKILLCAADTYRSAAVEQIQSYAEKLGLSLVHHKRFSDPGAVVYDSIEKAQAKGIDIILVDTAGRMHTSYNLMEELKKIKRVINKKLNRDPDEILMIIDSTTGQNAKFQAKVFDDALNLTGLILTKTDSTSKGGIVLTIKNELNIPIKLFTDGENLDNIHFFDPKRFADMLVA